MNDDLSFIDNELAAGAYSMADLENQARQFATCPFLHQVLDVVPSIVLVLNRQRQTIYANQAALQLAQVDALEDVLGLRPGEIFHCVHAEAPGAVCGTTQFCRLCGAAQAITAAQRGDGAVQACRIMRNPGREPEAFDFRVWTAPLDIGEGRFTVFALRDVGDENRRRFLERIFFHDVLNTAGVLQGAAAMLVGAFEEEVQSEEDQQDFDRLVAMVDRVSKRLVLEIEAQRDLTRAENGEIDVRFATVDALQVVRQTVDSYVDHSVAQQRVIQIAPAAEAVEFSSDFTLLERVVGNMLKNALEAAEPGQTVTIGCRRVGEDVEFWVHNPSFMPPDVQLQVFQRSFSTKGPGRGLGAYSMRLLSRRYLNGDVTFESSESEGTTFRARYPLQSPVE